MRRYGEEIFEPRTEAEPRRVPWDERWSADDVIFALEPFVEEKRAARILAVAERRIGNIVVVLDSPRDPFNGAAILRSSEALGLTEVHVIPALEPFLASRRVARGTQRWIDLIEHASPELAISELEQRGFELIATHPAGQLVPEHLGRVPRFALVLGNEHRGISEPLLSACRRSVRVPMRGFVESLNVSVTAAILLAAATRDRPGDLSSAERRRLYARGLWLSIPRAREVVEARGPAPYAPLAARAEE
jgi:tRNA (guanosine-2'-O-)-methyltransferase